MHALTRRLCLATAVLLSACVPSAGSLTGDDAAATDWPVYRGNDASSAYSAADQINRDNVHGLRVAWTYQAGDASPENRTSMPTNPILANGMLYVVSPSSRIVALHPATGKEIWSFDPGHTGLVRGVSYWEEGDDRRLLVPIQRYLYALNADDGSLIEDFGEEGRVDTRFGLGRDPESVSMNHTSPGVVFEDLLVLGSSVTAAPGDIRAYDIRTGEIRWSFHTVPHPGEVGYETWPADAYLTEGGANAWSGLSLDPARALVFISTGTPSPDFYGGDRKGENLFANSVVALDARTGEHQWHYQMVHHDIWDYDLPAPPTLVTVRHGGRSVDAVAQITKTGFVFLLDRETGEPLFPVEERPVPRSGLAGEEAWPTQPFPTRPAPFVRQSIAENDLTRISPEAHEFVLERFRDLRPGPIYTPPSLEGTLVLPGTWGGAEWSGAAYDPDSGILYVNANELPSIMQLERRLDAPESANPRERGRNVFASSGCGACHGADLAGREAAPSLIDVGQRLGRGALEQVIRQGRGAMPAFGHLPAAEMEALLAYLSEGGRAGGGAIADGRGSESVAGDDGSEKRPAYSTVGYEKLVDHLGRPGIEPPWGTLTAIDLNSGEHVWQIPLGEYPGVPEGLQPTGTPNFGGAVVTAGGLVFIGATMDEKFRAIDKETGRVLWEHQLPAGGYATPATYEFDGKQYVVIAAGGGGKTGTPSGDAYVAFALP